MFQKYDLFLTDACEWKFCGCIVFLVGFLYYARGWNAQTDKQSVEVSTNVPASLFNAELDLKIRGSSDPRTTNYSGWYLSGHASLTGPGGSSGSLGGTIDEWDGYRLIAINSEGFEVLFTKRWRLAGLGQKLNEETNVILFRYGQVTETNALGWKIVGKFKWMLKKARTAFAIRAIEFFQN